LDGLRGRYTDPSSPEQAGFHEGFADIVALLSIFSLPRVVEVIIDKHFIEKRKVKSKKVSGEPELIDIRSLKIEELRDSLLAGLGKEIGQETDPEKGMASVRKRALRESVKLTPEENRKVRKEDKARYAEPHYRGEVLVAAVMNAFLLVWVRRLQGLGSKTPRDRQRPPGEALPTQSGGDGKLQEPADERPSGFLNRIRVVEEGAGVADYLLSMVI